MNENQAPPKNRLDSWKEIARYLGKHQRTVIRWEKNGLPVHRVPGGSKKAVFAFKEDIDSWLVSHIPGGVEANPATAAADDEKVRFASAKIVTAPVIAEPVLSQSKFRIRAWSLLALGFTIAIAAGATIILSTRSSSVHSVGVAPLTNDGRFKLNLRTDGKFLYFNEMEGNRAVLASSSLTNKDIRKINSPFPNIVLQDISSNGQYLLGLSFVGTELERPLWYVPVEGGAPGRIGDFTCRLARKSPDNHWLACASGTAIILSDLDGHKTHTLALFPFPPVNFLWSPDSRKLRVALTDLLSNRFSFWEVALPQEQDVMSPSTPVQLQLGEDCCISWGWLDGGKKFVYIKPGQSGEPGLFIRKEEDVLKNRQSSESEIPVNIGTMEEVVPAPNKPVLYVLVQSAWRGQLLKYNSADKSFETLLPGLSAGYLTFSPGGRWISYIDSDQALWRSRADGTEPLKLSNGIQYAQLSSWSPDGQKIAFMGLKPGKLWRIFIVERDGGEPKEAAIGDDNQGTPTWSPDGKKIAYGNVMCHETQSCWIRILDLEKGTVEKLPGSHGFRTARWSPDGRWIAALVPETHKLMLFDCNKRQWRTLAGSVTGDTIAWSRDSQWLYADSSQGEKPLIERFRVRDGMRRTAVDLSEMQKIPGQMDFWFGLTPDGAPILVHRFTASEVYAIDLGER